MGMTPASGSGSSRGAVAETVVLTLRCRRRTHELATVVETGDAMFLDARRLAVGRERSRWTPARVRLARGACWRCGCACGQSWLVGTSDVLRWLGAGYTEVIFPPARVGRIGPVRHGANESP